MDQLRWILAGLGVAIIILIYLWGMRARIREELRRRRRAQQANNEPFLELPEDDESPPADAGGYGFDKFSSITPDHPLANQLLVDVEITPVQRPASQMANTETVADQPEENTGIGRTEQNEALAASEFPTTEPKSAEVENVSESTPESILDRQWQELAPEPSLAGPDAAEIGEDPPPNNSFNASRQEPGLDEPLEMTVVLTVLANRKETFSGTEIFTTAQDMGLKFHKSGVLDCLSEQVSGNKPVFSIAQLREPGVFDLDSIETLNTPGLLLFMNLPGPLEPSEALNFMLSHSQQLAQELGGVVCDEQHNRLTTQHMGHLQSKIGEFERQLRLHQPRY
ncbi:MAG: cell division protein ZipA C-terminal FtsZ-binding domain-containing protein [Candidatus Competibacteraceae bacterium]|jgi:cell division protein ZipA|nr:cell division protein ZipA C-terminal FtsZ-binding domain-containing protein [Candidatus Competibacteraceae bacterium]